MDHFGIGNAIKGMTFAYFQQSRRTGRTMSIVESVKDGDRIVFTNRLEAKRVERLCKERGVKIRCIVVSPFNPTGLMRDGISHGRTIFDHDWVKEFYFNAIHRAEKELDTLERETSGYGVKHRETKRQAEENQRWGYYSEAANLDKF
jgi:hypothetical protein